MKRPRIARLAAITAGVMLAAIGTLNSGVGTMRARAFTLRTVTSPADSGPGSLRDAVGSAADGDTIMFSLAFPATIGLTTGQIDILKNITITGPGANLLTVSGSHSSRIFEVAIDRVVTISGLTIAGGTDIVDQLGGGGISNGGLLSVTGCIFSGNTAVGGGGGIENNGTALAVGNCTFDSNSGVFGGAIDNVAIGGSLLASNSTFSNNTAGFGGAIENEEGAILVAENCTFA